ncbi:MAG: hypothetical protein LBK13_00135 [Spirochaetales bacterium]|jgi:hypothetical protein|nr:hypothetical protein [Spirochaetales bacterium]
MKSKILLPLLLLMLILPQMGYAQQPAESNAGPDNDYGIESEKLYPGWLVLEMLAAAESELEEAADEAYAEGYKAASLRYAPEEGYWKSIAESAVRENSVFPDRIISGLCGFALGGIAMGIYNFARH